MHDPFVKQRSQNLLHLLSSNYFIENFPRMAHAIRYRSQRNEKKQVCSEPFQSASASAPAISKTFVNIYVHYVRTYEAKLYVRFALEHTKRCTKMQPILLCENNWDFMLMSLSVNWVERIKRINKYTMYEWMSFCAIWCHYNIINDMPHAALTRYPHSQYLHIIR